MSLILAVSLLCTEAYADAVTDELVPLLENASYNFEEYIDITDVVRRNGWKKEEISDMLSCAYLYVPELFFVNNSVTVYYSYDGKYSASFGYTMTKAQADAAKVKLDAAAKKVIEGITPDMTDVEKALYVHDYIILNCKYDFSYKNFDAYDCLVSKSAVCQGYSLAYMYILDRFLGIDCTVVYSDAMQHAWNYVKIGNNWYHVDLTTDDANTRYRDTSYDNWGFVLHDNFLMSDSLCRKTSENHDKWTVIGSFPKASDTRYDNAFWRDSSSAMCFSGRNCYYSVKEKGNTGYTDLCVYDFSSNSSRVILKLKNKWYARRSNDGNASYVYGRSVYDRIWMSVTMYDGKIYFNSNKTVYSYDPKTKKYKKIYTLNKGENQIFGIYYTNGRLRIAYRLDTTYPEKYIGLVFKSA